MPSIELSKLIAYFRTLEKEEAEKTRLEEKAKLEAVKRNRMLES
jgi:hypothetical protein